MFTCCPQRLYPSALSGDDAVFVVVLIEAGGKVGQSHIDVIRDLPPVIIEGLRRCHHVQPHFDIQSWRGCTRGGVGRGQTSCATAFPVGVPEGHGVEVGAGVAVTVGVTVGVLVAVAVGAGVGVGVVVGVFVGVAVGWGVAVGVRVDPG